MTESKQGKYFVLLEDQVDVADSELEKWKRGAMLKCVHDDRSEVIKYQLVNGGEDDQRWLEDVEVVEVNLPKNSAVSFNKFSKDDIVRLSDPVGKFDNYLGVVDEYDNGLVVVKVYTKNCARNVTTMLPEELLTKVEDGAYLENFRAGEGRDYHVGDTFVSTDGSILKILNMQAVAKHEFVRVDIGCEVFDTALNNEGGVYFTAQSYRAINMLNLREVIKKGEEQLG